MNCRLFDASLGALLKHGWFGVERAVAEALRRVQRLVAGRDGVDDVMTTGATLSACGNALKRSGLNWLGGITMALV